MAIPFGRWLGVHVRLHLSVLVLLVLSAGYSVYATGSAARGIGLWLVLCAAVAVREVARTIAAAYAGAPPRALFLMPFGAVMALEPRNGALPRSAQRLISLAGAAANLLAALLLLGFAYGVDPRVRLVQLPWITLDHILRSAIWLQIIFAVSNLLPPRRSREQALISAATKHGSPATREAAGQPATAQQKQVPLGRRPSTFGPWAAVAAALLAVGIFAGLVWPVLLACTLLFLYYVRRAAAVGTADAATLAVRDVMLTEYTPLPASSTLRDALRRTAHSLQDTFPVVRGDQLVGWTSRSALATRLQTEGDGYLQGLMTRSLQPVEASENLPDALRRTAALSSQEFIPVVEDGAVIGILTPPALERALGQVRLSHTLRAERDPG